MNRQIWHVHLAVPDGPTGCLFLEVESAPEEAEAKARTMALEAAEAINETGREVVLAERVGWLIACIAARMGLIDIIDASRVKTVRERMAFQSHGEGTPLDLSGLWDKMSLN